MNTIQTSEDQSESDLRKLEQRVDELIGTCSHLGDENRSLKAQQEKLVAERAALIEKTELARSRVEAMITRLKALESGT
jgi:cell division protein ZapB